LATVALIYWLAQAIRASSTEYRDKKRSENTVAAIGWLLSAWGITLQLTFVALFPIKRLYGDAFGGSLLGSQLTHMLEAVRLTSPFAWFPAGIFVIGLTFFVVLRFADFPYHPPDFDEIFAGLYRPIVNEVVAAIRIPIWLIAIIIGFLVHFVGLLVQSFLEFTDKWLGRLLLAVTAIVLPTVALLIGHGAFFQAMVRISQNLAGDSPLGKSIWLFLSVHFLVLFGLLLYVIAAAPIGLEVLSAPIREAPHYIRQHFLAEGYFAAQATGKAFALYGIIFLAVPLACLLPGGTTWGIFSTAYASTVATLALIYILRRRR
jgi:hypothetical protein